MAQAGTTREETVLEIVREYPAPPERVWQAWTDPKALSRWFGPGDGSSVMLAELDARPGGHYSITFRTDDGAEHRVFGTYEEVVAPRLLSFTWAWQSTPDRVSFVRVELQASGPGTRMALRHDRFFDRAACDNHERGWSATLPKLDKLLAA